MPGHLNFFIISLALAAQASSGSISDQVARALSCGRVLAVSCEGSSGAARLLIASPATGSTWRVVIPAQLRPLFGPRIEERYEEQLVCVESSTGTLALSKQVTVREPSQLVVKGAVEGSSPLPGEVARTCDEDVQLPQLVRHVYAQITPEAMRAKIHGSIVLRGIVDRKGTVTDVRVVQSLEPSLDAVSREAFAQWKFRPAMRGGEPVPIAVTVEMAFTTRR